MWPVLLMTSKLCKHCNKRKSLANFSMNGLYRRNQCRECVATRKSAWRIANLEQVRNTEQKRYHSNKPTILRKMREKYHATPAGLRSEKRKRDYNKHYATRILYLYGLSEAEYDALLKRQGGKCAICKSNKSGSDYHKRLAVDHCHKSGRIRGILCSMCNTKLGWFEKHLKRILQYVQLH